MSALPSPQTLPWRELVAPGAVVHCSQMTSEPMAALGALGAALRDAPPEALPAEVLIGTPFSFAARALPAGVRLAVFGGMGTAAALARERTVAVHPIHYSDCGAWCTRHRPDVALIGLARDPASGRLYLGASHGYALEAARGARVVIGEVNLRAPCVAGGEWPGDLPFTHLAEADYALPEAPRTTPGEIERRIAANVAACVEDGATIQIGIGSLADAVAAALASHRRLSIHSGLMTAPLWALAESGAADNAARRDAPGVSVCAAVYGDAALYRAVHLDQRLRLAPPALTHGRATLAALPRFTAINGALEVDLYGQVNSEIAGGRYVGGIGGLNDFVRGAAASDGGRSIIALPARRHGRHGPIAGIVARLAGPATVCAADADLVVTEYGAAELRGASRGERARRLVAVAHPDDRPGLEAAFGALDLA